MPNTHVSNLKNWFLARNYPQNVFRQKLNLWKIAIKWGFFLAGGAICYSISQTLRLNIPDQTIYNYSFMMLWCSNIFSPPPMVSYPSVVTCHISVGSNINFNYVKDFRDWGDRAELRSDIYFLRKLCAKYFESDLGNWKCKFLMQTLITDFVQISSVVVKFFVFQKGTWRLAMYPLNFEVSLKLPYFLWS